MDLDISVVHHILDTFIFVPKNEEWKLEVFRRQHPALFQAQNEPFQDPAPP